MDTKILDAADALAIWSHHYESAAQPSDASKINELQTMTLLALRHVRGLDVRLTRELFDSIESFAHERLGCNAQEVRDQANSVLTWLERLKREGTFVNG